MSMAFFRFFLRNVDWLLRLINDPAKRDFQKVYVFYFIALMISYSVLQRTNGGTPIHLVCRLGALEILQCLYEHDPAAFSFPLVDKEAMTPLHR